jgi:hypothetical protein
LGLRLYRRDEELT